MSQEELNSEMLEAAKKGDTDRIWKLVERGADVNASNKYGWTALTLSAYKCHLTPELLEALVSSGADVNARNEDGRTVMSMLCTGYFNEQHVGSLLSFFSCGYSIRDMYDGWTPESFIKWLKDNKVKNERRTVYALLAALSLYPERNETLDEILYGRNIGAGLNMVLEKFSSMNESVWLPFVPSLLGAMAGDRKKPLNVKAENAPLMVRILLHCLETEPGAAFEFVKQRIGKKNLETWVKEGIEGANILVSRLVPYVKESKYIPVQEVGCGAIEFF